MLLGSVQYQELTAILKNLLIATLFPFVPATSINLLRLLDPEAEGSVTFRKVNNYLPDKKA
jgi:hypothetical protein